MTDNQLPAEAQARVLIEHRRWVRRLAELVGLVVAYRNPGWLPVLHRSLFVSNI